MFSHTQFGLSFLILTFDDKTNPYFARQQVVERLRDADLPAGVQPSLGPLSSATGEIYRYRLRGDHFTPMELRTLEDWVVERQLKQVPGVADVVTWGGFVKQYEVNPDLARMKLYKVTLQQLFQALSNGNANAGGSYVEQGKQQFLIRGIGLFRSSEDIGNVVVDARNGTPILVRHIADVSVGNVPRQGIMGQDDADDVVTGIVLLLRASRRRRDRSLLRSRLADRQDLAHGLHQSGRRRDAGHAGSAPVSRQLSGGRNRRCGDPAIAAVDVSRAHLGRNSGELAVSRRHGLRHYRRWRGHRRGKRL
jgi:cobalt-zinc-cadmium resistance protein CzcA